MTMVLEIINNAIAKRAAKRPNVYKNRTDAFDYVTGRVPHYKDKNSKEHFMDALSLALRDYEKQHG